MKIEEAIKSVDFKKKIVVPWSGGMDSTALVHCLATAMKQENSNQRIYAISISHPMLAQSKTDMEKKARKILLEKFKKQDLNVANIEINIGIPGKSIELIEGLMEGKRYSGSPQIMTWLSNILLYCPDGSQLLMSYVKEDETFELHRENAISFVKAMGKLLKRDISFNTPLKDSVSKFEIMEYLSKNDLLFDTHSCEHPVLLDGEWMNCNICGSCLSNMLCLMEKKKEGNLPEWGEKLFQKFRPELVMMAQEIGISRFY